MDLNRITDKEMTTLENLGLFTTTKGFGFGWIAEPNYDFCRRDIPTYDWNEGEEVFVPRTPIPERTPDA